MASKEVAHDCLGRKRGTGRCALLAIGSNWAGIWGLLRHLSGDAARSYAPIPLIGGVLGAAALVAAPVEAVNRWFWLPLLRPPRNRPVPAGAGVFMLIS